MDQTDLKSTFKYQRKEETYVKEKIISIHKELSIKHGKFTDELPEQKMAIRYLTGNEKILELGSSLGRNAMVMNFLQKEKNNIGNMVTMETDSSKIPRLEENRDINNLNFKIENAALSKRFLMQKGEETFVFDENNHEKSIKNGFKKVNTISLDDLISKYQIDFDTLVADCEGALFYILKDMPELLTNINIIIMENDYNKVSQKEYVDNILKDNGFYVDYSEPLIGHNQHHFHFRKNFFEVWLKH